MLEIDLLAAKTDERRVWLRVGTLLDGVSTLPLHNAHVVYDGKVILFAGEDSPPRNLVRTGQSEPDHDLPQYTLLPGLTDAHTHFSWKAASSMRTSVWISKAESCGVAGPCEAAAGEAGVARDHCRARCGRQGWRGPGAEQAFASGERPIMPYIDSPGAAIHHRGRYGAFMAEPLEDCLTARQCVEMRVKPGLIASS